MVGDATGGEAQARLIAEARATAAALLDWIDQGVDASAANRSARAGTPGTAGTRPQQSAEPCTWCPVCAVVAALRGEQPELTARLAEQVSGLVTLLRLVVQAHTGAGHEHHHPAEPDAGTPAASTPPSTPGQESRRDGSVRPRPAVQRIPVRRVGASDP